MSPPPSAALFFLGVQVVMMLAITNAAAFHQYRTTDPTEVRTPVDDSSVQGRGPNDRSTARSARESQESRIGRSSTGRDSVGTVSDD